jgi:hypothetical protein
MPWSGWKQCDLGFPWIFHIESFSTVEPAVDLTATSPLAFARQIAGLL